MSVDPASARSSHRFRPGKWLLVPVLLAMAGAGAWFAATSATEMVETRAGVAVRTALAEGDHAWAEVTTDGLRVTLHGTAPSEADRLRAISRAGSAVSPARITDAIAVAQESPLPPPAFRAELLVNEGEASLIGLVPGATDRAALRRQFGGGSDNLLTSADHAAPADWDAAFAFGLRMAGIVDQARITILPGQVTFAAIAEDAADKARIEAALLQARPEGVALAMDIAAPLPVIAPFALQVVLDESGIRLEDCAADTPESRDAILAAFADAGGEDGDCVLGLGAPGPEWGAAAVQGIDALAGLGAGRFALSGTEARLEAPAAVPATDLDKAAARLTADLPQPFRLVVSHDAADTTTPTVIGFSASRLQADAPARLRGHVTNDQMRSAVETVAQARLGTLDSALESDDGTPGGWTARTIAGIEVLAALDHGQVVVTPDLVQAEGVSGDPDAGAAIIRALGDRLGPGARYAIRVDYDRRLDRALGLPDGDECVARLNRVLEAADLRFAPGGAEFEGETEPVLADLHAAMQDCEEYRIEIGGHTDSQGSEAFNRDLSQKRAEAVLAAMADADIPVAHLLAQGHGPSQPVASNDTEEGREQNRRIEMRLLDPAPVTVAPPEPGPLLTGLTEEAPAPPTPPRPEIEPGTGAIALPPEADPETAPAPAAAAGTADTDPAAGSGVGENRESPADSRDDPPDAATDEADPESTDAVMDPAGPQDNDAAVAPDRRRPSLRPSD